MHAYAHNRSPRAEAINASPRPAATIAHGCVAAAAAALSLRRHSVVPWLRPSALFLRARASSTPRARSLAALRAL
ncbi:unnamed protein product [Schistocephalus solidus]|uniref:Uncharacterized protein n=1 Tax=Schistocephalus solidus TaxID=70667 RepID=A0A183SIX3_SCHSO|nr:unnamed protein product [Schistocephalus solidus]